MQSYIGVEDNFLLENGYLVARLEEIVLAAADSARFTTEDINEIFRIMHTIKSSAGIMMYENISSLANKLEDVFYFLRETYPENIPHDELVRGILKTADFITAELTKIKSGEAALGDAAEIIAELDFFLVSINDNAGITDLVYMPDHYYVAPKAGEAENYYRIALYYRNGTEMANVRAYSAIFVLYDIADEITYRPENITSDNDTAGEIMRNGFHIYIATKAAKEAIFSLLEASSGEKEIEIDESSVEEYLKGFPEPGVPDLIINLDDDWEEPQAETDLVTGAYVIQKDTGKAAILKEIPVPVMTSQNTFQIPNEKMIKLFELTEQLTMDKYAVVKGTDNELTYMVNEIRKLVNSMMKISVRSLYQKLDRAVYDISHKLGKVVDFETEGEDIEIDRNIAGLISEALLHIIRNAVDHGIEDKEERKNIGKKVKGAILLTTGINGGELFFGIRDDGRGLDIGRIYEVAVAQNLTDGRDKHQLSEKDIFKFIIAPGFSTSHRVTEYSGRGVGLDVVAANIAALGGRLEVDSLPGKWTEISFYIPRS
jgi:two-component system chemotaxis sensor kinase CheA